MPWLLALNLSEFDLVAVGASREFDHLPAFVFDRGHCRSLFIVPSPIFDRQSAIERTDSAVAVGRQLAGDLLPIVAKLRIFAFRGGEKLGHRLLCLGGSLFRRLPLVDRLLGAGYLNFRRVYGQLRLTHL